MNLLRIAGRVADKLEGFVPSVHESAPASEYEAFFAETDLPVVIVHNSGIFQTEVFEIETSRLPNLEVKDSESAKYFITTVQDFKNAAETFRTEKIKYLKTEAITKFKKERKEEYLIYEASGDKEDYLEALEDFTKAYVRDELEKYRSDFTNLKTLRSDCVNFLIDDNEGVDKNPRFIMHDFYHMHFEQDMPGGLVSSHKFDPKLYLEALLKDYDFTEFCKSVGLSPKDFEKAAGYGLTSQSLGSFYNALVGMIDGPDRARGAALKLFDAGEKSAGDDVLADILPIYFNPKTRNGVTLSLKPLYVRYYKPEVSGDISAVLFASNKKSDVKDSAWIKVEPKSDAKALPSLFALSVNTILSLMDGYLKDNIGNVLRVV